MKEGEVKESSDQVLKLVFSWIRSETDKRNEKGKRRKGKGAGSERNKGKEGKEGEETGWMLDNV